MLIELRAQAYDPWQEISQYQQSHLAAGGFGACAVFVGSMRDFNQGESVSDMYLEHYEGMTQQQLIRLADDAMQQHGLIDVLLLHRVGEIHPNDPIVLVVAWSAHRAEAFTACREMMEVLKSKATFWKKETLVDGERWVDRNTPG